MRDRPDLGLGIDHINVGAYIRNTIRQDRTTSREEALLEIYKVMRPGEPPTVETAEKLFYDLFFGKARLKDESVEARAEPEQSADVLVRLKRAEVGEVWILEQEQDWLRIIVPAANRPDEIEDPVWVPGGGLRHARLRALRPFRRRPGEDGYAAQSRW